MVLLDTCTFLWLCSRPDQLSSRARDVLGRHAADLFLSPISALEIALKHRKGHLHLSLPPRRWITLEMHARGIAAAPLTVRTALRSVELPPIHADPFDRLIIATALEQGWILITADADMQQYPAVQIAW